MYFMSCFIYLSSTGNVNPTKFILQQAWYKSALCVSQIDSDVNTYQGLTTRKTQHTQAQGSCSHEKPEKVTEFE